MPRTLTILKCLRCVLTSDTLKYTFYSQQHTLLNYVLITMLRVTETPEGGRLSSYQYTVNTDEGVAGGGKEDTEDTTSPTK